MIRRAKTSAVAFLVTISFLMSTLPLAAQDLVPVSDITGGSSVFVFRGTSKGPSKKFTTVDRGSRTKGQRIASAQKINRQYVTLAKVAPRRARTTVVDPHDLPPEKKMKEMPAPEAAKLFAGVGEYYIDKEDTSNAIEFFRQAYDLDKSNSVAKNGLSEALSLKGNEFLVKDQNEDAQAKFEEALKFNPNNGVAYYGLGEIYVAADNKDKAIENYEHALQLDKALTEIYVPLGILYYQTREIQKADELLSKAIANAPEDAETQYFLGLVRTSQNHPDQAIRAFRAAIKSDPNYAEAHYGLGAALQAQGKSAEAQLELQQAVTLKPNYFEAWFALGNAYLDQENYKEAIKAYLEAARLKNDNPDTYANLGDAYRLAGSYNDAEARYSLATTFIERDAKYSKDEAADVYSKIGYVLAKQCEINMAKAVPCRWNAATRALEKAVSINPTTMNYANLGWAYYNAAHDDIYAKRDAEGHDKLIKARDNLLKAVESNPNYLEGPLLNLGMTYSDLGDTQGAIETLKKVVDKEPKWTFAVNELGIAYFNSKNYKEASNQFRKAIGRDDQYAAAWLNLGKSEFSNGNVGEAKTAYNKLKNLNPRFAKALELYTRGAVSN
jgi:tetratricopeptide (TPR) repeat protein